MKLSDVKRRNRVIGVCLGVMLVYRFGLDAWLRRIGGPLFLVVALIPLFVLFPMIIEWLERKFVK